MHNIRPFYNWQKYYDVAYDKKSPFYGKTYDYECYSTTIYGYFIDPAWDFIGSETLYIKILYTDYENKYVIIELFGEWNDALHNDIMHLKRNIIDFLTRKYEINKFIFIGENILNFHGSDDCYYEEWFEDIEGGWIAAINFREHVYKEWEKFHLDYYINYGGNLQIDKWRVLMPQQLFFVVDQLIQRRISLA